MSYNNYSEKVNWLFQQFPAFQKIGNLAYKPTLENTKKIIELLEIRLDKMNFIHVAGTNGKGTTCSIIASALTESGKKVGLFTSPHIRDFRERIRVNGAEIDKKSVVDFIDFVQRASLDFSPSFFELTWGLALRHFQEQNCDIIIAETGLGGRLDATNVITPLLSVITNIGIDHETILGNTRKEIAYEKAGIIKRNIPVIIGEKDEETASVFIEKAKKENAPIYFIKENKTHHVFEKNKNLAFEVLDKIMADNSNLEKIKTKAIQNLFKNTGLIGRNQVINEKPLTIVDAAHNVMGIKEFIRVIQTTYFDKNIYALYGTSKDKNAEEIISFFPKSWNYFFTEFSNNRSANVEDLILIAKKHDFFPESFKNAKKALFEIKSQITDNEKDIILVFGSFYLLADII